jgi:CRISPR-associated protein Cmr2
MGPKATVSAGLAVVHYKEDLRRALEMARRAEKRAKQAGRDILEITTARRSGGETSALCPWHFVDTVDGCVEAFRKRASDRWAYHLAAGLPTLQGLPVEAARAEIRRQVQRSEIMTRERLGETDARKAGDLLSERFEAYRTAVAARERMRNDGEALTDFVTLCQTASFFARGRDR